MNTEKKNNKSGLYTLIRALAGFMAVIMLFVCLNGCAKKTDNSSQSGNSGKENSTETGDNQSETEETGLTAEDHITVDPTETESGQESGSGNGSQSGSPTGGEQSGSPDSGQSTDTDSQEQNPDEADEGDEGEGIGHF